MYEYFDACQQGITVDTDYIRELVGFTKDFEADFSETGSFLGQSENVHNDGRSTRKSVKVMLSMDLKALQQNGDVVVLPNCTN